jgi:hypothetical protein
MVTGLGVLCARRLLTRRVRLGTDRSDKPLFPLLAATVLLGISATAAHNVFGPGYDYRETVSVWFRGVFTLQPRPEGRRRRALAVPAARSERLPALRGLAVHPAGARVERPDRCTCGASRSATFTGPTWCTAGGPSLPPTSRDPPDAGAAADADLDKMNEPSASPAQQGNEATRAPAMPLSSPNGSPSEEVGHANEHHPAREHDGQL